MKEEMMLRWVTLILMATTQWGGRTSAIISRPLDANGDPRHPILLSSAAAAVSCMLWPGALTTHKYGQPPRAGPR